MLGSLDASFEGGGTRARADMAIPSRVCQWPTAAATAAVSEAFAVRAKATRSSGTMAPRLPSPCTMQAITCQRHSLLAVAVVDNVGVHSWPCHLWPSVRRDASLRQTADIAVDPANGDAHCAMEGVQRKRRTNDRDKMPARWASSMRAWPYQSQRVVRASVVKMALVHAP